jgi:cation:H+ antiporter
VSWLMLIAGLVLLVAGADLLVRGASKLALSFGVSPLVVGLTIVAFGTSAPEVAVSVSAVLDGNADIAVGNVVGSNIFNVLFILGVSSLISPLVVNVQLIRQEVPVMVAASALLVGMGWDGAISRGESGLLFALLLAYTTFLIVQSRAAPPAAQEEYAEGVVPPKGWDDQLPAQIGLIVVGLALLVLGSDWLVDAATTLARAFGVSDLVIGLTIVAAGTSMPEVATSIAATIKGERDIAVGNVVGSNTFNILGCLGLSGLVGGDQGLAMSDAILAFDAWIMLATAVVCLPVFITGREIARWEGAIFLGYYVGYVAYLILAAQDHASANLVVSAMMVFAAPLTLLMLAQVARGRPATT